MFVLCVCVVGCCFFGGGREVGGDVIFCKDYLDWFKVQILDDVYSVAVPGWWTGDPGESTAGGTGCQQDGGRESESREESEGTEGHPEPLPGKRRL